MSPFLRGAKAAILRRQNSVPAPSGLTYSTNPATYTVDSAITSNSPTVTGDVTSYSVSPALPSGLSLNTSTGVITGTPVDEIVTSATYIITASNSGGSTTCDLVITTQAAYINWTTLTNMTQDAAPADGGLTKSNATGLGTAVARTTQTITGAGRFGVKVAAANSSLFGLHDSNITDFNLCKWCIQPRPLGGSTVLDVYELGVNVHRSATTLTGSDEATIRVAANGTVTYYVNNTLLYTSAASASGLTLIPHSLPYQTGQVCSEATVVR
jgi:hypothetical protein